MQAVVLLVCQSVFLASSRTSAIISVSSNLCLPDHGLPVLPFFLDGLAVEGVT